MPLSNVSVCDFQQNKIIFFLTDHDFFLNRFFLSTVFIIYFNLILCFKYIQASFKYWGKQTKFFAIGSDVLNKLSFCWLEANIVAEVTL